MQNLFRGIRFGLLLGFLGVGVFGIASAQSNQLINGEVNCKSGHNFPVKGYVCGIGVKGFEIMGLNAGNSPADFEFSVRCPKNANPGMCNENQVATTKLSGLNSFDIKCVPMIACDEDKSTLLSGQLRDIENQITTIQAKIQNKNADLLVYTQALGNDAGGVVQASIDLVRGDLTRLNTELQALQVEQKAVQARIDAIAGQINAEIYTPNVPVYPNKQQYEKKWLDGDGLTGGINNIRQELDPEISRSRSLSELVISWLDFLFPIIALVAVLAIIYAGFLFIVYYGNDEMKTRATNIILYVIIGIVLVFAAFAIVSTLISGIS